jgi:hypothetical protein
VNNAIARAAGLIGISVTGVIVASTLPAGTFAANDASVRAFHQVVIVCAVLVATGGLITAVGVSNRPGRAGFDTPAAVRLCGGAVVLIGGGVR